jgi:hypothetical protein
MSAMQSITQTTAAALVAATLGLAPAAVRAEAAPQAPSGTAAPAANGRQAAIRQHLSAAQQSLAEMTKLPAATQLQGDVRTSVASFISEFNAFATASSDWKAKYQVASASLDKMLASAAAAPAPAAAPAAPAPAAGAPAPAAEGPGTWDPTVVEKLKDVRKHLDNFETATGDPLFVVEAIEKILADGGAASGTVTLDAAKLAALRQQLEKIKAAAGGGASQ